jgi:hypothetical protein
MAFGQNTFLEMSRSLRLYVPQLPVTLAEQFVRDRYRKMLDARDWSATVKEAEFILKPAKSAGTVAVTQSSTQVVGTGTAFAATDIGRQFKAGIGSPIYTITDVDVSGQILTLDRIFGPVSNAGITYYIVDAYVTPPEDFLRFLNITDPLQGWKLRHWITANELNTMDPMRTFFGQPYLLADRMFSVNGATAGRPQYEAWPYSTAGRTLYYTYIQRGDDLVDADDLPIWPIRSDIIVQGALCDVARWPGTTTQPNPYFSRPDNWQYYDLEFRDRMVEIERTDEDVYMTMLDTNPYSNYPLAPISASFIQSHAIR